MSEMSEHRRVLAVTLAVGAAALAGGVGFVVGGGLRPAVPPLQQGRVSPDRFADDLTLRALDPGSPLACLDAAAGAAVESGCERVVFASPIALAVSIKYIEARLSVLLQNRSNGSQAVQVEDKFVSMRRALEADPYGLVAHVLAKQGCLPEACAALTAFGDPARIVTNLRDRSFDAHVALHAPAWGGDRPVAAAPPADSPSPAGAAEAGAPSSAVAAGPVGSRYDFPSSASIPAVSIMNPEPPTSAEPNPTAKPAAPRRSPAPQPPR